MQLLNETDPQVGYARNLFSVEQQFRGRPRTSDLGLAFVLRRGRQPQ